MSPRLPYGHISEFVKEVMPKTSTMDELLDAQTQLDDVLDVIDRIHDRLTREGYFTWQDERRCMVPWKWHTRHVPPSSVS